MQLKLAVVIVDVDDRQEVEDSWIIIHAHFGGDAGQASEPDPMCHLGLSGLRCNIFPPGEKLDRSLRYYKHGQGFNYGAVRVLGFGDLLNGDAMKEFSKSHKESRYSN